MTALHHEIHADADAATVWEAIADFGAVHERFAVGFVTATEVEGDEREVTFANGVVARELRLSTEPDRRRLAYSVIDSPAGLTFHHGVFEVVDDPGSPGCRIAWTVDLLPAEAAPFIDAMMATGAEAIAATFAGDRAGAAS
jgi:hypothetical protein